MDLIKKLSLVKSRFLMRVFFSFGYFIISSIALSRIFSNNKLSILISIAVSFLIYLFVKPNISLSLSKLIKSDTNYWVITLSTLVGLFSVFHLIENANLEINSFNERTIGITVLTGLDVSARSWIYISSIILFIIVFTAPTARATRSTLSRKGITLFLNGIVTAVSEILSVLTHSTNFLISGWENGKISAFILSLR